jgi:Protein of unknown function (DUF3592)
VQRSLGEIQADVSAGRLTQEQAIEEINRMHGRARSRRPSRGTRIVVIGTLLFIGLIFGLIGAGIGLYSYSKAQNAERTTGEVVKMLAAGGKGGSKPVVRYTVDGRDFEIQGWISTSPPAYTVGEKVTVLYDRNNPADGHIDTFVERWLFPVIFSGIGGVLLFVSLVVMLSMRPRRPVNFGHEDADRAV